MSDLESREILSADNQNTSNEETFAAENEPTAIDNELENTPSAKKKITKKMLILCGIALVAIIVVVIMFLIPSHFEKVRSEVVQIAGMVRGSDGYFVIDTYPDMYEDMDPMLVAMIAADDEKNALEAIKYANIELGFSGALYNQMLETNALMGRQTEENDDYKVSWTYHPDDGLEVTYEEK